MTQAARKERNPAFEQAEVLRDLLLEAGLIVHDKDIHAFPKGGNLRGEFVAEPTVWLLARRPATWPSGSPTTRDNYPISALAEILVESLTGRIRVRPYNHQNRQDRDFADELRALVSKAGLREWLL